MESIVLYCYYSKAGYHVDKSGPATIIVVIDEEWNTDNKTVNGHATNCVPSSYYLSSILDSLWSGDKFDALLKLAKKYNYAVYVTSRVVQMDPKDFAKAKRSHPGLSEFLANADIIQEGDFL